MQSLWNTHTHKYKIGIWAHVANSPQIKLNIQIDKIVHATFKFTDSRQSQIKLIQDSIKYYITDG